jgi:hypothetical protein
MTPWMPISGVATIDSAVQSGHVGQPSPDPVSRTAPPVATMSTWEASSRDVDDAAPRCSQQASCFQSRQAYGTRRSAPFSG